MEGNEAGQLLRRARVAAGITQAEVARRACVPQSVISAYETGRREPSLPTLRRLIGATGRHLLVDVGSGPTRALPDTPRGRVLAERRDRLRDVVERHGASNLRVFGSVARGDDDQDSDIDLLVDLPAETSLLGLIALRRELSDVVGEFVDLVPSGALRAEVGTAARLDAVAL